MKARVLVVDDHPVVRLGLATMLRDAPDVEVVAEAGTLADARSELRRAPDIVLLDDRLPDGDGLELLPEIQASSPKTRVLALMGGNFAGAGRRALRMGAAAYVTKDPPLADILTAVREVAAGRTFVANGAASPRTTTGSPCASCPSCASWSTASRTARSPPRSASRRARCGRTCATSSRSWSEIAPVPRSSTWT